MLMLKSTHAREMAAKDAEIATGLQVLNSCWAEIDRLEARLAKFTGPRERGQGGRFVSGGVK